jgi:galactokinase/mevalonate kinase-like predicted kinase
MVPAANNTAHELYRTVEKSVKRKNDLLDQLLKTVASTSGSQGRTGGQGGFGMLFCSTAKPRQLANRLTFRDVRRWS